jgi:hypothetical protein
MKNEKLISGSLQREEESSLLERRVQRGGYLEEVPHKL